VGAPEVKYDPRQLDIFACRGSVCDNPIRCAAAARCTYISSAEQMRIEEAAAAATALPSDSKVRKTLPIATGVLDYFPAALAEVAKLSQIGNDKHNPGQPLHWSRGKSSDHADCIVRHLIDRGTIDQDSRLSHTVAVAWRALALLQEELEEAGAPRSRGSR
jgi:hypothetical protein